jgi:putative membrane protein
LLFGFGGLALLGYGTFGLHPGLLARVGDGARFYGPAFEFFGSVQIWLAGAVLALLLSRRVGVRWLPSLLAVYALSLASELAGTTWGVPFGSYEYTALLGARWLDRVPVVIPLSWYTMALPAYALAMRRRRTGRVGRALLASGILLAWDLVLDPAMSYATLYWVWSDAGPYYGMPLLNLLGWYVTGLALMAVLSLLGVERWLERVPLPQLVWYYGANLLLPLGMCLLAGLWGAVAAATATLALAAVAVLDVGAAPGIVPVRAVRS